MFPVKNILHIIIFFLKESIRGAFEFFIEECCNKNICCLKSLEMNDFHIYVFLNPVRMMNFNTANIMSWKVFEVWNKSQFLMTMSCLILILLLMKLLKMFVSYHINWFLLLLYHIYKYALNFISLWFCNFFFFVWLHSRWNDWLILWNIFVNLT